MQYVNLRNVCEGYRLEWDEAKPQRSCAPEWLYAPCGFGRIYAHDERQLVALVYPDCTLLDHICRRLVEIGCSLVPDGGEVRRYVFPVSMFREVAEIIRPSPKPIPRPAPVPPAPEAAKKPSLLTRLNPWAK